jgi:hypothetical protein
MSQVMEDMPVDSVLGQFISQVRTLSSMGSVKIYL